MNREIQFRVWSKTLGKFLSKEEYCLDFDGGLIFVESTGQNFQFTELMAVPPENYVIQQYTGLNNRKFKPIYEGDIFNTKAARWVVAFEDGAFWAKVVWSAVLPIDYTECLFLMSDDVVPLGNIFENPELLS